MSDSTRAPIVCVRIPPGGQPMVAVVLDERRRASVVAAFRRLRVPVTLEASSITSYDKRLRRIHDAITKQLPREYRNLELLGGAFPQKLNASTRRQFEPLCPRIEVAIHALHAPRAEPTAAETAWVRMMERRYGTDYVSTYTEAVGISL